MKKMLLKLEPKTPPKKKGQKERSPKICIPKEVVEYDRHRQV